MRWFGCWVVSLVLLGGCTTAPREPRPARLAAATGEPLAAGIAAVEYDEADRLFTEAERRYPALANLPSGRVRITRFIIGMGAW